jgi:hypothetical protein
MKEGKDGRGGFEERLLGELKSVVARRSAEGESPAGAAPRSALRRRAPRLALGAGAVVIAAVAVLAFSSGDNSTSTAFAVEPQSSGGVTIRVYSAEDASGLEAVLAEAGIRSQVTWLPAGMACREPRFTPSSAKTALGGTVGGMAMAGPGPAMTIGVMSHDQYRDLQREYSRGKISADTFHAWTGNITLDPTQLRPDQSVVISGAPGPSPGLSVIVNGATGPFHVDPEGGYEAHFAIAEGSVGPCEPVKVPKDQSMLEKTLGVLEAEAAEHEAAKAAGGGADSGANYSAE